jgi:DNA-binding PadR family transcriptional regulator
MLALGARTGYDVRRAVELSARYFWTISPVQIYPALKQLEAAGLATGRDDPSSPRRRRTYKLTPAGRAALRAWVDDEEEAPVELRDLGLLKLFFADTTEPASAIAHCRRLAARNERMLERFRTEILPAAEAHAAATGNRFPLLTAQLGHDETRWLAERYARLADELTSTARRRRASGNS